MVLMMFMVLGCKSSKQITSSGELNSKLTAKQLIKEHNKKEPKFKFVENDLRLDFVDRKCNEIIDVVNNIRQYAEQLVQEQSIGKLEFDELLVDLELRRRELETMSTIIKR